MQLMTVSLLKIIMTAIKTTATAHPAVSSFFYQAPPGGLTDTDFTMNHIE